MLTFRNNFLQFLALFEFYNQILLSTLLNQLKLVYGPFGQSNMNSVLDICPRPAREETNVHLHMIEAKSLLS